MTSFPDDPPKIDNGSRDFDLELFAEPVSVLCLRSALFLEADLLGGSLGGGGGNIDTGGNLLSSSSGIGCVGNVDCRIGVCVTATSCTDDVSDGMVSSVDRASARL